MQEFRNYEEFRNWLRENFDGKVTEEIEIMIPNEHGNKIIYSSPLDVLHAHEE